MRGLPSMPELQDSVLKVEGMYQLVESFFLSEAQQMLKRREDPHLKKAEIQLCRARNPKKKADTAAQKPFLDVIKAAFEARHCRPVAQKLLQEQAKGKAKEHEELKKQAKSLSKEQANLKKQANGKK